jgi:type II secretory ATPase GspE/PulE/Tfp pilus assembly ATPase PilB-like protein
MDPIGLADAILAVLALRVCKTICRDCKEAYRPSEEEYGDLAVAYGNEAFEPLGIRFDDTFMLHRGRGCQACNGSGLKGQMRLQELLIGTDRIRWAIRRRATVEEVLKIALEDGMTTLVQDGIAKVLQGWTTLSQVKAVTVA